MTINKALNFGKKFLTKKNFEFADLESQVLLAYILNKNKEYIFSHLTDDVPFIKLLRFFLLLQKRANFTPVSYILNKKEFYKLEFEVNKNVLIPRPETELIVDIALEKIKSCERPVNIAELGTGSGCISVSILKNTKNINKLFATDISFKALQTAKRNAQNHALGNKINFLEGDFLKPLKNKKLDIIISNPPYLSLDEYDSNPELKHEPKLSLTDGKQGLNSYKKIFSQIKDYNLNPKYIILEIGCNQAVKIKSISEKYLKNYKFSIYKDLCKRDRIIVFRKN